MGKEYGIHLKNFQKNKMSFTETFKTLFLSDRLEMTTRDELRSALNVAEQYLGYLYHKIQGILGSSDKEIVIERAMRMTYDIGITMQKVANIRAIYCSKCQINGNCCDTCEKTLIYYELARTQLLRCDQITKDYANIIRMHKGEEDINSIPVCVT